MASENMSFRIKELRKAKGLTLEEVGDMVGVGKSTVRKWETGIIANMKRDKIAALAKALDTTPAYLMGWKEEETPEKKPSKKKYKVVKKRKVGGMSTWGWVGIGAGAVVLVAGVTLFIIFFKKRKNKEKEAK